MLNFQLTSQQVANYEKDGYIIVKNFLTEDEVTKLSGIALGDSIMQKHAIDLNDQTGKKTKLTSWYFPGNDAYGLLTKSKRIVESVDRTSE